MKSQMYIPMYLEETTIKAIEELFLEIATKVTNEVIEGSNTKQYFNKKEAAEYLGVSFNTLRKFEKEGLPVAEIGGMQLIRKVDIDRFLEENIIK